MKRAIPSDGAGKRFLLSLQIPRERPGVLPEISRIGSSLAKFCMGDTLRFISVSADLSPLTSCLSNLGRLCSY